MTALEFDLARERHTRRVNDPLAEHRRTIDRTRPRRSSPRRPR
jgi:hypothetical protein